MTPRANTPPVLLIVFRRPEHTRLVFEAIRRQRPSQLFIAADAPRANRGAEEKQACDETRRITEEIDWPCEVHRDYATENMGCALRPNSAITRALSKVDRVIVLEDDCLPGADFFPFCAELLDRYADDDRISAVCGVNLQDPAWRCDDSYYFSRYAHSWGWATWRRAWKDQDLSLAQWAGLRKSRWLRSYFGNRKQAACWSDLLDRTMRGEVAAWDYPWNFNNWLRGRLAIHAARNLVTNIGFGPGATNTTIDHAIGALPIQPLAFPLRHPAAVARHAGADDLAFDRIYKPWSIWRKLRVRMSRIRNLVTPRPSASAA